MAKNPRLVDITAKRFGDWRVVEKAGNEPRGGALWTCVCKCGERRTVRGADLRAGRSSGCGCRARKELGARSRTHGDTGTRLHSIWRNMKSRCYRESLPGFKDYGARGITVCDEWQDFAPFRDWALANGYSDDLSIERLDVDGNYDPANCTWANAAVQSANRRFTQKREDGVLWIHVARSNGIPDNTYHSRVYKQGWDREKAATTPPLLR